MADSAAADILRAGRRARPFSFAGVLAPALPVAAAPGLRQARPDSPGTTRAAIHRDAAGGQALYQACAACHSLDESDVGPKHRRVVGRHAGTVPGA